MTDHESRLAGGLDRISTRRDDVDSAWMARLSTLSDREVDSLLCGDVPPGGDALAPIADVALALRRRVVNADAPQMSDGLRRQLADSAVVPLAPRSAMRLAGVKAAAAAIAAAVVLVGVGASQNSLPAGLQNAVSSAAELVGVEVPRADAGDDGDPVPIEGGRDAEGTTPGGATPADPGTAGEDEPANAATAPENGATDPGTPEQSSSGGDPKTVPDQSGSGGQIDPVMPAPGDSADPPKQPAQPTTEPPSEPERDGRRAPEAGQPEAATADQNVEDRPTNDDASSTGQSNRTEPPPNGG